MCGLPPPRPCHCMIRDMGYQELARLRQTGSATRTDVTHLTIFSTVRVQVSFGVHKSEQEAARQYDRALIIVKGRLAKTNFPMTDYEAEVKAFEAYLLGRRATAVLQIASGTP